MGYLKDTIRGVSWMGALRASTRGLAFIKIAVLARVLLPEQFGLFGIASLALSFLEIVTETGINVFLIQEQSKLEKFLNTAWVVSIVRGVTISLILLLLAPSLSSFFRSPESLGLLYLISVVPVVRGFINPAIIIFRKDLQFNKEFWLRTALYFSDAIVSVLVAVVTRSPSALIWGLIVGSLVEVYFSHRYIAPRPIFAFDFKKLKEVIGQGKWMTLSGIFNYLFQEGDDILVGRLLQTNQLGLYQMAYRISTLPITEVADVFGKVSFPVYTKISEDKERLYKAFRKTILATALVVFPMGAILFVFPQQIVSLLLGENWLSIVPTIKILSIFGIVRAISGSSSALFLSVKKQRYVAGFTFVSVMGMALLIIPLIVRYGMVGAAMAVTAGSVLAVPFVIYWVTQVFKEK